MIDIEIQTYWNVETLYYVFNGVASIMAGAGFAGLMKMIFYFAIAIGIFAYAGNRQLEMAKWFVQALIFTTILNLPIARVGLTDKTGLEPPRTVDNVPFTLAITAQTVNLATGWLTTTYESVFGVPEDLGLAKGDLAFGHRILKRVNQAIIRDAGLRSDLMQFLKECTLYDVKDGEITPDQVIGATDTWNTIFDHTSPARYSTYNTLTPTPVTEPCTWVAGVLKGRVDAAVVDAQTFYGKQSFTRADSDALATSMFVGTVGTSYNWILGSSATASDAMKQAMFNNMWRDAGAELPAMMGDTARIQELQNMAGAAQAARQADGSNATISALAQETLPHMRNWLEAIIFSLFPVMVVLVVCTSTNGARNVIGGYMMSIAWVELWPIMFAVINHLSLLHLQHKAKALALAAGVPFQLSDAFDATLGDEQAAIGYLVILVPFLSAAIIKMGAGGFMSVADKMVSGFSSAGNSVGTSLANGNQSLGQAGIDTASVNTTSMSKYDSNIGLSGGGATIGYGNGSVATVASNGAIAMQQLQNRLLTSMSLDTRSGSDRSQEAHETDITSKGTQLSTRHSDAASLTSATGHDSQRGSYQNSGVTAGYSRTGSESGTHSTGQGLNRSLRDASNFNMAAGAVDTGSMSLGVGRAGGGGMVPAGPQAGGAGAPGPAGPGAGPTAAAPTIEGEKRIVDAMKKTGASQSEIANAVKNYRGGATETVFRNITDDFGNQVRVPVGQQKPGTAPAGAPSAASKVGAAINAGLGFQSSKQYSASHARDRSDATQHSFDERANVSRSYGINAQRGVQDGSGQQSSQGDRQSKDAALTAVDDRSSVRDVSDRREVGVGSRSSYSQSESLSIHRDLMADPNLLEKVAQRNGMTAARFMGQEEGRMMAMVRDYVAEKGMVAGATKLNPTALDGTKLPTTRRELDQLSEDERNDLPDNIRSKHRRNVSATGFQGTTPVATNTSMPALATAAEQEVKTQLDPAAQGSIQQRAGSLDENAAAWASRDKKVGEGRANPLAVVEDIEIRDVADTGKKVWDKLTGGDGTADGEKLNDNKKRETGTQVQIGNLGGRK